MIEVFEHSSGEMVEFFASIHSSLGGKLDEVMNRLTGIGSQMSSLQACQKSLEDEVRLVASSYSDLEALVILQATNKNDSLL